MRVSQIARSRIISPGMSLSLVFLSRCYFPSCHRSEWPLAWRPRAVADPGIVVLCVGFVFRVCFVGVAAVVLVSLSQTAGLFCRVLFQVVSNAMRVSQIARSRIMSPERSRSLVVFHSGIFLSSIRMAAGLEAAGRV